MKPIYKDYLFTKHILVSEPGSVIDMPFEVLVTLGQKFGIRITENSALATLKMVEDVARNTGEIVPEPFYRGFPRTVRELSPNQLLFDQLLHYTQTYGIGWFDRPGHSAFENLRTEDIDRVVYNENLPAKDFRILSEEAAMVELLDSIKNLMASNRPLPIDYHELIVDAWYDFRGAIIPDWMACKDTVIFMLYGTKALTFCRFMKLSDVIKLLAHIQHTMYHSEKLNKLNLRNRDRKFITSVINEILRLDSEPVGSPAKSYCDYSECFEKRKIWCGLLHHIHYSVPHKYAGTLISQFVKDIRSNKNFSVYHDFEYHMRKGEYATAAMTLVNNKGKSALIRNLNYILSRCKTDEEIKGVLAWLA